MEILGVKIDSLTREETLEKIEEFLKDNQQRYLVTPNPEFLVKAQKDEEFCQILNQADLAVPDGIGLVFASWFLGQPIKQRITGADLVKDILKIAQKKKIKVVIFNWSQGLSSKKEIEQAIENKYPGLRFKVEDFEKGIEFQNREGNFSSEILFVNFGAPEQEKFIYHNLKKIPSVRLAIGVGGAFDFITNRIKRAPKPFRVLGLEWFWRLFCQPWRARRIFNAVVKFPWLVVKSKYRSGQQ
jgi:N-acetylglucosaminyldiphosphoundecaprenol N-acetyl-beta-D-mannosaminyltransferase